MDKYVGEKVVRDITERGLQTLRNDRCKGVGIPYCKIGKRSVRYRLSDVYDYMESHKVKTADSIDLEKRSGR